MNTLSIFVDESGDFGAFEKHAPYYLITMVFHKQSADLSPNIHTLNHSLSLLGYGANQAVHTEPLIRRELPYQHFLPNERRAIFSKLYYFTLSCDIVYKTFLFHKKEFPDSFKLEARMAKDISQFIREHQSYFQSFENVILYYDNGQHELNRILNTVLATELSNYELRKVHPCDYKLFQAADLICTLELTKIKLETRDLSKSEQLIFHTKREFRKDFLKGIKKKEWS